MSWVRFGFLCVIYVVAVPVTLFVGLGQAWWGGDVAALGIFASLVVATPALFLRRAPSRCAAMFVVAAAVAQVVLCWSFATEATADNKYSDIAEAASFSNAFWLVGAAIGVAAFVVGLSAFVPDGTRDLNLVWVVPDGTRDLLLVLDRGLVGVGSIVFWVVEASAAGNDPLVGLIEAGPIALYALAAVVAAATTRETPHPVTGNARPV